MSEVLVCETNSCDEFGSTTENDICGCCGGLNVEFSHSKFSDSISLEEVEEKSKENWIDGLPELEEREIEISFVVQIPLEYSEEYVEKLQGYIEFLDFTFESISVFEYKIKEGGNGQA